MTYDTEHFGFTFSYYSKVLGKILQMESEAALALVKAIQIPLSLLSVLNLTGPLFPPERYIQNNTCFDHIIVGAGTAGCILANRLSEDPGNTVLLLEAGGNQPITSFFPPLFVTFPRSQYDWDFKSTYDSYAASAQNGVTKLTAGKGLGGTSSISHFIYERGSPKDYDNWADILNDDTWKFENVEPYFKKTEKLEDPEILNSDDRKYHGLDGPTANTRLAKKLADKFIVSFNETGNRTPLDLNTYLALGDAQCLFTASEKGVRQSTAYSYLTPIKDRKNLYVRRHTLATRILFEGNRAVAVVTIQKGKVYIYRARKEIIVSAGVYNSPKLLMLSGIGPKEHLDELNIPVIADLPVGMNYRDQVSISIVHRTKASLLPPPIYTIDPLDVPFPVICGLNTIKPKQEFADYLTFALFLPQFTPFLILACAIVFQFKPEICDSFNNQNELHETLYTLLGITQPCSTGYVRLNSTDPFEKPLITTGYFTDPRDLVNMREYIKDFLKIGNSTYFQDVNATMIDPGLPECKEFSFGSDEYFECYALHTAGSVYHASSTCAMGAVLDSKLKVKNVTNLRVVDASSMPTLPNAGPYQAVLMIAEKASDIIKEDESIKVNPNCQVCQKYAKGEETTEAPSEVDDGLPTTILPEKGETTTK